MRDDSVSDNSFRNLNDPSAMCQDSFADEYPSFGIGVCNVVEIA